MKRDVMVNSAVTVVPRRNGIQLVGEKDHEICQFAFELQAKKLPWPEKRVRQALFEQAELILEQMRGAGFTRV